MSREVSLKIVSPLVVLALLMLCFGALMGGLSGLEYVLDIVGCYGICVCGIKCFAAGHTIRAMDKVPGCFVGTGHCWRFLFVHTIRFWWSRVLGVSASLGFANCFVMVNVCGAGA